MSLVWISCVEVPPLLRDKARRGQGHHAVCFSWYFGLWLAHEGAHHAADRRCASHGSILVHGWWHMLAHAWRSALRYVGARGVRRVNL